MSFWGACLWVGLGHDSQEQGEKITFYNHISKLKQFASIFYNIFVPQAWHASA